MAFAVFALGAIIASFVGVFVARFNTGEGFIAGRSRCDACNAPLTPFALVPVISFFVSNGRARCCGHGSLISPLSEPTPGTLFVLLFPFRTYARTLILLSFLSCPCSMTSPIRYCRRPSQYSSRRARLPAFFSLRLSRHFFHRSSRRFLSRLFSRSYISYQAGALWVLPTPPLYSVCLFWSAHRRLRVSFFRSGLEP